MFKRYIINILLMGFSVLVTLGALELFACFFYEDQALNYYDHRVSQPEPYQNSNYFSEAFIRASTIEHPVKWNIDENTRVMFPSNCEGEFFNVKNNLRVTTNAPDSFSRSIHLFGGSTIYNLEVPDQYTVGSYLQRTLNNEFPNQYKVHNYGAISINTAQQLARLKTVNLNPNDIVVFYGGVNDGLLFTTGRVDGYLIGEQQVVFEKDELNLIQKLRFKIYRKFHQESRFVEKFLNPFTYQVPQHLNDSLRVKDMQSELFNSYKGHVTSADSISRTQKAEFYNFLQPHIYTRKKLTSYEEELIKNRYLIAQSWLISLKLSYEVLPQALIELEQLGIACKDLRKILDNSIDSHYLDSCHITEKGNEIVATSIFNFIFKTD